MTRTIVSPWIVLALAVSIAAADPGPSSDFIVAKVNGEIVTTADVLKDIGSALDGIDKNELLAPREKRRKKLDLWTRTVRDKVEEVLALQAAQKLGVTVRDEEVTKEYDTFVERVGGEDQAREWAKERGITWDEIQLTIRRQLTIKKLILEKIGLARSAQERRASYDSFVRPSEIRRHYTDHEEEFRQEEAVRIRQLCLPWGPDRAATRREAVALREQIRRGADMGALAELYSPGQLGRHGGRFPVDEAQGKLTWQFVGRGVLRSELEAVAFRLPVLQLSEPIETDLGLFLVRVEERRESRVVPFEEAQSEIRNKLQKARLDANLESIRDELRREAQIWPPNLFREQDFRILNQAR